MDLDLSGFNPGIYIAELNGHSAGLKVVKE